MHVSLTIVLLMSSTLAVLALPANKHRNRRHGHSQQESPDDTSNVDIPMTSAAVEVTTLASTTRVASSESPRLVPAVMDYDRADYPSDTTGIADETSWGAWNEDDDADEMDVAYPDDPMHMRTSSVPSHEYFTDLEDYTEEGPSFQKLILLAASRNHHRRAIRLPTSSAGLTIAVL